MLNKSKSFHFSEANVRNINKMKMSPAMRCWYQKAAQLPSFWSGVRDRKRPRTAGKFRGGRGGGRRREREAGRHTHTLVCGSCRRGSRCETAAGHLHSAELGVSALSPGVGGGSEDKWSWGAVTETAEEWPEKEKEKKGGGVQKWRRDLGSGVTNRKCHGAIKIQAESTGLGN